jgi:hypothetical protein
MTTPPAFASNDLARVRRNPWFMGLAMSPLLGALALVVAGLTVEPTLLFAAPQLATVGAFLALVAYRANWRPLVTPASVRADAEGVTVAGHFVPRAAIRKGLVLPGAPPRVLLERSFRPDVEIQVSDVAEGRALLRALGLDASQAVADFRTPSRALSKRRYGVGVGLGLAGLGAAFASVTTGVSTPLGPAALAVGMLAMLILFVAPTNLGVGADGIAVRWLWTRRFLGFDEMTGVTRFEKGWGNGRVVGIRVALRSGETVDLPTAQGNWGEGQTAVLLERIREAVETFRQGGAAADAALLRRGDRGVGEWIIALRSLGAGANADMRTAPVPRERLFRVVEDPAAPAADRAAAAVALGSESDEESRARLRAAAAATAAPRLRIAIEKAADGEEAAELEAALAEIEGAAGEKKSASR